MKNGTELSIRVHSLLMKQYTGFVRLIREDVKNARLVANPGCYTTCSILTAYPLAKEGID